MEDMKGMSAMPNPNPTATGQDFMATDCDEYSLTAPQTQWRLGAHEDLVTFEVLVRRLPPECGFLLTAGLADCLDFLERFRFTEEELAVLATQTVDEEDPSSELLYAAGFIDCLRHLSFTGEVHGIPEGTVIGPGVPILRLTAPRIQATIVEAAMISILNQATSVATEAARLVHAAGGLPVWDGSLRRNPGGVVAGLPTARAAYIAGVAGTSAVRARVKLGLPTMGTMMHAEVQRWGEDGEQDCFEAWLTNNPHRSLLLPDTYEVRRGVERAIAASVATGVPLSWLRLDSGDHLELSRWTRSRLDAAGMGEARIMLSNDLEEFKMAELMEAQAPADGFLVGTYLANPRFGPLGVVYKLTQQEELDPRLRYVMKRAVGKATDPGAHRVWRDREGRQIIALPDEIVPGAHQLTERFMALGRVTHAQPSLEQMREHAAREVAALPEGVLRWKRPEIVPVARTRHVWELRASLGDSEAQAHLAQGPASPSPHLAAVEDAVGA